MQVRDGVNARDFKHYTTERIRDDFLITDLFEKGKLNMTYSNIDRIIAGSAVPLKDALSLQAGKELGFDYFLERRELGVINIGGKGKVRTDQQEYALDSRDGVYIGMGAREVHCESIERDKPAKCYLVSAPAHQTYPNVKININDAKPQHAGSLENSNKRTIYKYVHPEVAKSCQLAMGMTLLEPKNVWNTMPTHTHARRMEVYLYFDMSADDVVFHFMGEPGETRHIVVRNEQAVINPSWSIHSGVGTGNYTFIWGMVGENQTFSDMDDVPMQDLK